MTKKDYLLIAKALHLSRPSNPKRGVRYHQWFRDANTVCFEFMSRKNFNADLWWRIVHFG